ncbi:AI-2E family transporter [Geobacter pelophilus]|uniref:AI-2E family transporter n=1 Tax=Geoanaerobacter pelophilus TaxID=60036 RepID=A0AAW4LFT7_9BACT|nr:AI-2E family transporter [Geoanaerobacter pelophilus]MBT0666041.1 AI-2E family transporter [Geoanaerobacter pelophilus]
MERLSAHVRIYWLWAGFFLLLLAASLLLRHTLSAVLTSLAIAYLLNPLMKYMEAHAGFPRWLSLILLYLIVLIGCFFASFVLVPYTGNQIDLLTLSLPGYIQNLKSAVNAWRTELSFYYTSDELAWLTQQATEILNHLAAEVSGKGYERVKGLGFALFDLLLAPILVFFLLSYKESAKKFLIGLMPDSSRGGLIKIGNKINRTLERFLYAMLLDCILVGILCSAALYLLGVDFALLNGMIAGFSTVVPFIGATISVIPPILIGYLNSGDLMLIPKICGVYFLIHVVVEGNLIKPLLMRGALHLNPLAVIFALMALGEIMGFWGVVLAVPLTAVIKICSDDIHAMLLEKSDVKAP